MANRGSTSMSAIKVQVSRIGLTWKGQGSEYRASSFRRLQSLTQSRYSYRPRERERTAKFLMNKTWFGMLIPSTFEFLPFDSVSTQATGIG